MAEVTVLAAQKRTHMGTGGARALRRDGRVPGTIYGAKADPMSISVDARTLGIALGKPGFFATLFDLDVEGGTERVLCRDLQLDPIRDFPIHIDFLRVSAASRIDVAVPVHFVNEEASPGLKKGGVLNIVRHEVELSCRADSIPQEIVIDLTGREVGDSIHISDVSLPDGVQPTISDRDFTIATVAAPTVVVEPEEEAAAEAEAEAAAESEAAEAEGKEGEGKGGGS